MSDITLHSLTPAPGSHQRGRRVGRGGKRGTTSGRGTKGQRARTGGRNKLAALGLRHVLLQTPQRRGHAFRSAKSFAIANVGAFDPHYAAGETITMKNLVAHGVLKGTRRKLKVLGEGTLTKAFIVKAHAFSAGAKSAIEKAGGKAEVI